MTPSTNSGMSAHLQLQLIVWGCAFHAFPDSQLSLHFSFIGRKISPVFPASFCPLTWQWKGMKDLRPTPARVEECPW